MPAPPIGCTTAALTRLQRGPIVRRANKPGGGVRKIDLTNFKVATSETARQINRRIALNFLRRQQPMSRADLARRSGLQRSTVSSIIDQLIGEGWVTEGAVGRGRRDGAPAAVSSLERRTGRHSGGRASARDDDRGPGRHRCAFRDADVVADPAHAVSIHAGSSRAPSRDFESRTRRSFSRVWA